MQAVDRQVYHCCYNVHLMMLAYNISDTVFSYCYYGTLCHRESRQISSSQNFLLFVILYGSESSSLSLKEEHK
jgi:hypothetical protein